VGPSLQVSPPKSCMHSSPPTSAICPAHPSLLNWITCKHVMSSANNEDDTVTWAKVILQLAILLTLSVFCVTNCKTLVYIICHQFVQKSSVLNIQKHKSHPLLTALAIHTILILSGNYHCHFLLSLCWACGHLAEWEMLICQTSQQEVATDCWVIKRGPYIIQTMTCNSMVRNSALHNFMRIMSSKMLYLSSSLLTMNCLYWLTPSSCYDNQWQ